ncbi:MAG: TonB-dependent receptor, partial [Ignavibacteriaceae bacterium]|nr:TonB-dependent receptor [Ignavibacteriaceae bacterium]
TDSAGSYSLSLPNNHYYIKYSYVGFDAVKREVLLNGGKLRIDVLMYPVVIEQPEINISGMRSKESPVKQQIKEKDFDRIPNLFSDVIRSVKILPGVTSNNELTSAYNVRGGNFSENLIYLNGYEIYRPFLLQQGIEESQSIINQDMVGNLVFYNGAFPAEFGDKMSSALEVNYKKGEQGTLKGTVHASLLNLGVSLSGGLKKINFSTGFRFAYPSMFSKVLQTKGNYNPQFKDFQFFTTYFISNSSNIELFFLSANNEFDLTPDTWRGHFQVSRGDVKEVSIEYTGEKIYNFNTSLTGLKLNSELFDNFNFTTSAAYYINKEAINKNIISSVYFSDDGYNPNDGREYLKSRYEKNKNNLNINTVELKSEAQYKYSVNTFRLGMEYRTSNMKNILNESNYEQGKDSILFAPENLNINQNINYNSIAGYLQDDIYFNEKLKVVLGVRYLKYYFTDENLISPRASLTYTYSGENSINILWGYYYQPPYFYEVRDKEVYKDLRSQKAVHYIFNWQVVFNRGMKFTTDVYYKQLSNLIPYYLDDLKIVYSDKNNSEGYAYGFDLQFEGELVKGMNTWIGYSYLNTKDRKTEKGSIYQRRLLDQTHTIRIFLQDKMPKIPSLQSHVNFMFGTGFLFHPRKTIYDESAKEYHIVIDYDRVKEYPFYFRVDMGLTYKMNIGGSKNILFTAEVFNIFNKNNIASYSWYHVFPETTQPIAVPNIFSPRFFNVGAEFSF